MTWLVGLLLTVMPMPTMIRVRFGLSNNSYTVLCMYDKSLIYRRILFFAFLLIVYVIPFIIHVLCSILIVRKMRQQRAVASSNNNPASQQNARERTHRFKVTNMFITLIFAFTIPYMLFVCYNGVAVLLKLEISLTIDYAVRMAGIGLMYANGAVGATILFCQFQYLRNKFLALFCDIFPQNIHASSNQSNITAQNRGMQQDAIREEAL